MIFRNAFNTKVVKNETLNMNDSKFLKLLGIDSDTPGDKLSEATYFACMKVLAESMGKLPLKMFQHTEKGIIKSDKENMYNFLKLRPNPYMTATVFWSTVEMNKNHYGNGYVWNRYKGPQLLDSWVMPSQDVKILIDNAGFLGEKNKIWYQYTDRYSSKVYTFNSDDIMHFKTSLTFDGITGIPVREILDHTVNGALESQKFMNNLYKSGLTGSAVLEYTGDLNEEAKKRLKAGIEDAASGSKNAGGIIPIPLGMKLVPLNLKLTDSQFFELKKYTALQIAAAFGIKPSQINDYEKSSYASAEAQNLAFYTDTLLYNVKQYEEEITYKSLSDELINDGYFWKFNVSVILRADSKTQMEVLAMGVQNGILNIDDAREKLDYPMAEGGNMHIVNGNYIPLTKVGEQYGAKGGEE